MTSLNLQSGTQSTTDSVSYDVRADETTFSTRYVGVGVFLLLLFISGVMTYHPGAIAAGIGCMIFLYLGLIKQPPEITADTLEITRTVTPTIAQPEQHVSVTVTVKNVSDETLTDIRVVDDTPDELTIISGSPRGAGSIRPGEEITVTYSVIARRGEYTFDTLHVRARSLVGNTWRDVTLHETEASSLQCRVTADGTPVTEKGTSFIGSMLGVESGEGIEFDKTREYTRGDSPRRINWRNLAKRGELSTITYREHQTMTVNIVADFTAATFIESAEHNVPLPLIISNAVYEVTRELLNGNHNVGVTALGVTGEFTESERVQDAGKPWTTIPHQMGKQQQRYVRDIISEVDYRVDTDTTDIKSRSIDIDSFIKEQKVWAPHNSQYIVFSPLLDSDIVDVIEQLNVITRDITVIVPVVVPKSTSSTETAYAEHITDKVNDTRYAPDIDAEHVVKQSRTYMQGKQQQRIQALKSVGMTVITWPITMSFTTATNQQTTHKDTTL